jgi:sigma-B regulation protein RsbU (phosphoserine phosphatase)
MFVTLYFGVLDLQSLQLHFSSAGHTVPSLLRNGECIPVQQESGPALALQSGLKFPVNRLQLESGDLLAVYTDGIDEAFNVDRQQFTTERFNHLLEQSTVSGVTALGESVFAAVDKHAGEMPQSDDITCLLLQIPAASASLQLANAPGAISALLKWLAGNCAASGVAAEDSHDLSLVSEEVVTNILKYAELPASAQVEITFMSNETETALNFRDSGQAFDPLKEAAQAELGNSSEHAAIGGLGVHLLLALTDAQHYQRTDGCNLLTLKKNKKQNNH